jgi:hypothetical protein
MQLRSALGVGVDIEDPGHYVTITDGEGNAFLLPTPEELSVRRICVVLLGLPLTESRS